MAQSMAQPMNLAVTKQLNYADVLPVAIESRSNKRTFEPTNGTKFITVGLHNRSRTHPGVARFGGALAIFKKPEPQMAEKGSF